MTTPTKLTTHVIRLVLGSLVLSSCAATQPAVQTPSTGTAVAEKPSYQPGDWWEFKSDPKRPARCDGRATVQMVHDGLMTTQCTKTIDHVNDTGMLGHTKVTTLDGEVLLEFKPYFPAAAFPMWVGKKWSGEFEGFIAPDQRWRSQVDARVSSLEDVRVPAGTFKAYRIEYTDHWRAGRDSGSNTYTIWFAPEARTFVKQVSPNQPRWDFELVAYNLK